MHSELQYLDIMTKILNEGVFREGRNGGTYSIFGERMRFDLAEGFPLLTTKKLKFDLIVSELLWFLRGDTNVEYLHKHNNTIWDEWADEKGELGRVYGAQWRSWNRRERDPYPLDQIKMLIKGLKENPYDRRHIVTAWNPGEIDQMALPPCHMFFQCYAVNGKLSLQMYQRSADWFLGVPFNIASYALLTHLLARECDLEVGEFVHIIGDAHLYANHLDQAREQIYRKPKPWPRLHITPWNHSSMLFLEPADISVIDYDAHPHIKAEVSA